MSLHCRSFAADVQNAYLGGHLWLPAKLVRGHYGKPAGHLQPFKVAVALRVVVDGIPRPEIKAMISAYHHASTVRVAGRAGRWPGEVQARSSLGLKGQTARC